MEENRLISMVDFVMTLSDKPKVSDTYEQTNWYVSIRYANFLNQSLNIGQFVPVVFDGGKWVVLEEPTMSRISLFQTPRKSYEEFQIEYQQAKDNVIFEGFEVVKSMYKQTERVFVVNRTGLVANRKLIFHSGKVEDNFLFKDLTIQDLIKYKPTLTKYGQQQAGL